MENFLIDLQTSDFSKDEIRDLVANQLELLENISTLSKFGTYANFRLNSGKIKDDICSFVEQYLEKVAQGFESMIDIKCNNSAGIFIATFNPMEIGMVRDNLISNSKKARASIITTDISQSEQGLQLLIVDNGRGIQDSPERLFEKGFTRTSGSGIGLYFCKKLLAKINAEIELTSPQPKHGASFTIRIPR